MSALNLVKPAPGRFVTRSSRLVKITGSEQVNVPQPGGGTKLVTRFVGQLFKADGITVDSTHRWEESGAFVNQRGVASQYDLCQLVALDNPPAAATGAPAVEVLEPHDDAPPAQKSVDFRLVGDIDGLSEAAYDAIVAAARKAKLLPKGTRTEFADATEGARELLSYAVESVLLPLLAPVEEEGDEE